jgi:hypothetical protein
VLRFGRHLLDPAARDLVAAQAQQARRARGRPPERIELLDERMVGATPTGRR